VLTIPTPAGAKPTAPTTAKPSLEPNTASKAQASASPPAAHSALGDFYDEELSAARSAGAHATACSTCGRPYPPGEHRCNVCDGVPEEQSKHRGESSDPQPFSMPSRFDVGDEASEKRRLKEARSSTLTGWLVKGSTVAFIAGVVLFVFMRLSRGVSDTEIENQVGAPHVSNGHLINSNAGWLDLNLARLPGYVDGWESGASKSDSTGNGMWVYAVKGDRGQSWQCAGAIVGSDANQKPRREEQSLTKLWMNQLGSMGYFREPSQQPDPIVIEEFSIREPGGRNWVLGREKGARQLCNLGVMLGCQRCSADLTPLMKVKRGSLAYAIFFSAVNQKVPFEQKIARSCDADADVRTFAAEMLLSTLPHLPGDAAAPGPSKQDYEALLTQLAKAVSPDEKTKLYSQIRDQVAVK
jgi:hypothetical protein